MTTLSFDALVLDARLRQSLATIRSLGRRNLSVAALDTSADPPAFWSRWCRGAFLCPAERSTAAAARYLDRWLETHRAQTLIASHDGTIALLRRHRAALERKVRIALAHEPAMTIAVNKHRTLAVAQLLGIRVPRTAAVRSAADLPAALAEIGLPAVVKPTESCLSDGQRATWIGPQLVTSAEEARTACAVIASHGGIALLQPLLTGRREAVSLFYASGEVRARFAQWARRMNPPLGGESVLRQSIAVPADIGSAAERLVRAIDLEGYSEIEFRRDAAGVPFLMEVNPRLSASVDIAIRSGVDFPHLLYQWATGRPIDPIRHYKVGRWMRYLQGDVSTTIEAIRQRGRPDVPPPLSAARDFGLTFLRPMRYDYVDWADPLPAVRAFADFGVELARRVSSVAARAVFPGAVKSPAGGPSRT